MFEFLQQLVDNSVDTLINGPAALAAIYSRHLVAMSVFIAFSIISLVFAYSVIKILRISYGLNRGPAFAQKLGGVRSKIGPGSFVDEVKEMHNNVTKDLASGALKIGQWEIQPIVRKLSMERFDDKYINRYEAIANVVLPLGLLATALGLAGVMTTSNLNDFQNQVAAKLLGTALALVTYVAMQFFVIVVRAQAREAIEKELIKLAPTPVAAVATPSP